MPSFSAGDRNLHQRLIGRDVEALGEVFDLYAAAVYGVALRVTADGDVADDVTRLVLLELWRRPQSFDPGLGPLRPWLARMAHSRATTAQRDRSASRESSQEAEGDDSGLVDIDEAVGSVLKTEEVRAALAALPDDESSAIRLAYFGGKTYPEVAFDLGVPAHVVKGLLCSGLRRMADSLHGSSPAGASHGP